jgi:hypothetical protein
MPTFQVKKAAPTPLEVQAEQNRLLAADEARAAVPAVVPSPW